MDIQSTRFGVMSIEESEILTFTQGLIGFPDHNRFALLTGDGDGFYWLQSADDPELAFCLADPLNFFKDYLLPIREETEQALHLEHDAPVRVLVICNTVGDWLTGNLLGPIVINPRNGLAVQVVLTEKKWTVRQPLTKLVADAPPLAKAA